LLANGPKSADELAIATKTDPPLLYRVLRDVCFRRGVADATDKKETIGNFALTYGSEGRIMKYRWNYPDPTAIREVPEYLVSTTQVERRLPHKLPLF
jgi:hypothetical protein